MQRFSAVQVKNIYPSCLHSAVSHPIDGQFVDVKNQTFPRLHLGMCGVHATKVTMSYITQSEYPISWAIPRGDRSGIIVDL